MNYQQIFPVKDPIWECFIVISLILFIPIITQKIKFPQIAALILTGVLIGKSGLDIISMDNMLFFCSKIGLLFIMFFAGLEIDIEEMKKTGIWGVAFGIITFIVPFLLCLVVGIYILDIDLPASLLMGCVLGSQTLISYPIISRYGLSKHPSVTISVTGALIAILLALIGNAFIRSAFAPGNTSDFKLWLFLIKFAVYVAVIIVFFPRLTRSFFKKNVSSHIQFLFVFMLLSLSSGLASFIGLEGILGAFLAGLILGRYIPHSSPLMNRIDFIGNTLFIPIFLLTTGMIIDLNDLMSDPDIIIYFGLFFVMGTIGKWIAAWFIQKSNRYDKNSRVILFGLSVSHAAGALAITMGAFSLGLIDNTLLSATILIVLFSCITSNIVTERGASRLHLRELKKKPEQYKEKILVILSNPETTRTLMETVIALRQPKNSLETVGLHITINGEHAGKYMQAGKKDLEMAARIAATADIPFITQNRIGNNIIDSIIHSSEEYEISYIILGLTAKENINRKYYYDFIQQLVSKTRLQVVFSRLSIPLNTIRQIVVLVAGQPIVDKGLKNCIESVNRLSSAIGCSTGYYCEEHTINAIKSLGISSYTHRTSFSTLGEVADMDWTIQNIHADHMLILIGSRSDVMDDGSSFGHIYDRIHSIKSDCSIMLMFPMSEEPTISDNTSQVTNRTDRDLLKLLRM